MISAQAWTDARRLWDYHQMGHTLRPCSVAIGLGSHDLGVADTAVDLYKRGLAPLLVFTGATSPTTPEEYADSIQDARLVIDMLVGALQRLLIYPEQGYMISQRVPDDVLEAYERLCHEGFTSRLSATDQHSA